MYIFFSLFLAMCNISRCESAPSCQLLARIAGIMRRRWIFSQSDFSYFLLDFYCYINNKQSKSHSFHKKINNIYFFISSFVIIIQVVSVATARKRCGSVQQEGALCLWEEPCRERHGWGWSLLLFVSRSKQKGRKINKFELKKWNLNLFCGTFPEQLKAVTEVSKVFDMSLSGKIRMTSNWNGLRSSWSFFIVPHVKVKAFDKCARCLLLAPKVHLEDLWPMITIIHIHI